LVVLFIILRECQPELERASSSSFADFDTLGLTKISIDASEMNKDITLEKISEIWKITAPIKYKADKQAIKSLLKSLGSFPVEPDVISENPEKQAKFKVDSTGTVVKVYKDDKLVLDFIIGKTDKMGSHTYSRETGSDKVVSIPQRLSYKFEKTSDRWRDKVVLDIPSQDLDIIDIIYRSIQVTYINNDSVWTIEEKGETLNRAPDKLRSITNAFSPFRSTKFQDEEVDLNWSAADMTIKIITFSGKEYVLRFITKDDKNVYVKVDGNDQIFIISNYMMKRFQKTLKDYEK